MIVTLSDVKKTVLSDLEEFVEHLKGPKKTPIENKYLHFAFIFISYNSFKCCLTEKNLKYGGKSTVKLNPPPKGTS